MEEPDEGRESTLRHLFPELTDEELEDAEELLGIFAVVILRQYERIRDDTEGHEVLQKLTGRESHGLDGDGRTVSSSITLGTQRTSRAPSRVFRNAKCRITTALFGRRGMLPEAVKP